MGINELRISLSSKDASAILKCIPLSDQASIIDVFLVDDGIEAIVRTAAFLGMPVRIRFQLLGFEGPRISLKTSPPLKFGLESDLAPLIEHFQTKPQDNQNVLVLDLLTLGKGRLKSVEIANLSIRKEGLIINLRNIQLEGTWQDIFMSFSPSEE